MTNNFQCAQIYQILALNDEMLKNGCITRDEHDFVRHVPDGQADPAAQHARKEAA